MKFAKDRDLLIRIAAVAAVLIIGIFVLQRVHVARIARFESKKPVVKGKAGKEAVAKKVAETPRIPSDKGGITVKLLDSSGADANYRIGVFKTLDSKKSIYTANILPNRLQILAPGNYDLIIETLPKIIYKDIKINQGRETILNIGAITGGLTVKMFDSKGKPARYSVSITNSNIPTASVRSVTNSKAELYPGVYDIQVLVSPAQVKSNMRIIAGREEVLDLGQIMGSVLIKAIGKDGKGIPYTVRIKEAGTGKIVTSSSTNRSIELVEGKYDIDIMTQPIQDKKGVVIKKGEELIVEVRP